MPRKWKGYAKKVSGYRGEKYALFRKGVRTGTSTLAAAGSEKEVDEKHKETLRGSGYRIMKGTVRE